MLSEQEIRKVATRAVAGCASKGGMGEVTVGLKLSVGADGSVSAVKVAPPYGTSLIGKCVDTRLQATRFRAARQLTTYEGELRVTSKG
jgi:hypothetical protein